MEYIAKLVVAWLYQVFCFSGPLYTIISGGFGGVALWVAIFPADVVKSRVQVESTAGTLEPTFRAVIRQVFKEEGKIKLSCVYLPSVVSTAGSLEPSIQAVI